MIKRILVVFAVIASIVAMETVAPADVPQLISFQGKLYDNAGNPLTGQRSIAFRIYAVESGGTSVWSETKSVACDNGLYNVILGQTTAIALSFDGQYWLGVQVAGDSELTPRYRLVSVPTAFRAQVADEVSWTDLTDVPAGFTDGTDDVGSAGGVSQINAGNGITVTNPTGPTATVAANIGNGAAQVAAGNHDHDTRYYTETELKTDDSNAPNAGSNMVHWNNLWGVPAGFADGTDDVGGGGGGITQVAAGWGIAVTNPSGPTATVALQSEVTGSQSTPIFSAANTGTGYGLQGQASGAMGVGVLGAATSTGYSAGYGGSFSAASDLGRAVYGEATSTNMYENFGGKFLAAGGSGKGVYGKATGDYGTGVSGEAAATGSYTNYGGWFSAAGNTGAGVSGQATATGNVENCGGIFDASGDEGRGVKAKASGARGQAVRGEASATGFVVNHGGYFEAAGDLGRGVYGKATATGDVLNAGGAFESSGGRGVGVVGNASASGDVENTGGSFLASGNSGRGVYGKAMATGNVNNMGGFFESAGDQGIGVLGKATASGDVPNYGGKFHSDGDRGRGVYGAATATGDVVNYGGKFEARGNSGIGIHGQATATGDVENYGGWFWAHGNSGRGVYGGALATDSDSLSYGGYFEAAGTYGTGVRGIATGAVGLGIWGEAPMTGDAMNFGGGFSADGDHGWGVYGVAYAAGEADNIGGCFLARGNEGIGVWASVQPEGEEGGFAAVWGDAASAPGAAAGIFVGDVSVTGILEEGGGACKIDHPVDPENKYLYHSSVTSPDMMNVYNGNVTLNAKGEAAVELPEYFGALNRDFRYQLTCIGGFAPVYVAEEISGNRFKIAGGKSGLKVSWQVTGIRKDAYANAHRIAVEEDKSIEDRGKYVHAKELSKPEATNILHEKRQRIQSRQSTIKTRSE